MTTALLMVALVSSTALAGGGSRPITATGHAIQNDVGSCNNDWATDGLYKAYKLTLVTANTYNLQVNEGGSFTTLAAISPGACEKSAIPNGNTVAAGVKGFDYQRFNATVTSTTTPNLHPSCAGVDGCVRSGDFLDAVFGAGNYLRGDWSFTAFYVTWANGTYFDTSVNWPLNNRGDITS
jgi:hypothetical protein